MKSYFQFLLLSCIIFIFSCEKDLTPVTDCVPELSPNTRYFEFITDRGQTFQAWTTDTVVINQVLEQLTLPEDQRNQHINGQILENPEGCAYNQNWSWHFDPQDWAMAEASIELCDGDPQYVEENLAEYVRTGRFCPWSSMVLREINNPFE